MYSFLWSVSDLISKFKLRFSVSIEHWLCPQMSVMWTLALTEIWVSLEHRIQPKTFLWEFSTPSWDPVHSRAHQCNGWVPVNCCPVLNISKTRPLLVGLSQLLCTCSSLAIVAKMTRTFPRTRELSTGYFSNSAWLPVTIALHSSSGTT